LKNKGVQEKDFIYADLKWDRIEQFTGLCDEIGTPVYEGDIIRLSELVVDHIVFRDGQFTLYKALAHEASHFIRNGRIIGNIYKNPELLREIE
jgi:hypothetical protein